MLRRLLIALLIGVLVLFVALLVLFFPAPPPIISPEAAVAIAASTVEDTRLVQAPQLGVLDGTLVYEVHFRQEVLYLGARSGIVIGRGPRRPLEPVRFWSRWY